ncbi:MAG: hypothetical protein DI543_25610, partial [Bradyrhizobium icense]
HGFLSLSLATKFWSELFDLEGVTTKVNYGLDKVRFISPVKVGFEPDLHGALHREFEGVRQQVEDDLFPHVTVDVDRLRQV